MPSAPALVASFETSASQIAECPQDDVLEIAFVGRSNAGKSSSLNRLFGSKRLARVSKTPGRTRLINMFTTSVGFRVADLPGYGYAKASRREQDAWNAAVDTYLEQRHNLRGLVLVIDARHPLKPFDQNMLDWAVRRELVVLALLNKADKLKRNAQIRTLAEVQRSTAACVNVTVQLFSAATGLGSEAATDWLRQFA
ncbi:MAG: YihA family ribosome biogenesis GTP-binding protein [Gammaproteobacteria bacterium]|nr:YihA family ribosome biogenesis GTP-binding protein [Gammaproteobacteria bacterium]